jgi:ketosteroid isomerase-like protein
MSKHSTLVVVLGSGLLFAVGCSHNPSRTGTITQDELVRRTQQLMDAVAPGDQTPWQKYFADDAIYVDEKGKSMDKNGVVADITPMPAGFSGSIKILNARSNIQGDTAILSYDLAETETVFGQELHARYHATDTWRRRHHEWQIVAGEILRYYEDPAPGKADVRRFPDYVGTYQLAPGTERTVTVEAGKLYTQRGDRPRDELFPEASSIFFRAKIEGRILFREGDNGKVDALIDRRNNEDVVWKKVK